MSLSGNVDLLAARIAEEFVTVRSEIPPGGGDPIAVYGDAEGNVALENLLAALVSAGFITYSESPPSGDTPEKRGPWVFSGIKASSFNLSTPSTMAIGDTVIVVQHIDYDNGFTTPSSASVTGWEIAAQVGTGGTDPSNMAVWTGTATQAGVRTVTITNSTGSGLAAGMGVYIGGVDVDPFATSIDVPTAQSIGITGITAPADSLVLAFWSGIHFDDAYPSTMTPTGMTNEMAYSFNAGGARNYLTVGSKEYVSSIGTGTLTATFPTAPPAEGGWAGIVLALTTS